jgi:hypothetical protein
VSGHEYRVVWMRLGHSRPQVSVHPRRSSAEWKHRLLTEEMIGPPFIVEPRIEVRDVGSWCLALDAPEAQCRCGHAQRVHVTDVDWDEHSGCTSTGCDCRLFAIPEAQEADRG